ncbi:hypothetical protein GCM10018789_59730 [Streptomyces werraensis]|nr:hypothetical protein GCM10018789_59730 [Streptomyces werraensis]
MTRACAPGRNAASEGDGKKMAKGISIPDNASQGPSSGRNTAQAARHAVSQTAAPLDRNRRTGPVRLSATSPDPATSAPLRGTAASPIQCPPDHCRDLGGPVDGMTPVRMNTPRQPRVVSDPD